MIWQVKYETRDYHTVKVEADTREEAEDRACLEASMRRHDVYAIRSITIVEERAKAHNTNYLGGSEK